MSADALDNVLMWVKARAKVLVPVLGLPVFLGMVGGTRTRLTTGQVVLVWGLAVAYTVLVLWSPMALPAKERQPVTWVGLRRVAAIVAIAALPFTACKRR